MLKKKITYEDYDGNQRTEEFYFNLSQAELQRYYYEHSNEGLLDYLRNILLTKNSKGMMDFIAEIINISYGVKSDDGKRFIKDANFTRAFTQTEAYSELYMELLTKENAITDFLYGCLPKSLIEGKAKAKLSDEEIKAYMYGNKSLEEIAKNVNT